MTDDNESEQIRLMQRMVELAEYRTRLAEQRNEMSAERSRMSADRSRMSEDRSRMSEDRSRMSEDRSRMSEDRSRMSADRSEKSEDRSYMNAERTLSVWTRTALALMVAGIAVDRFALLLQSPPRPIGSMHLPSDALSTLGGAALVAFGIVMSLASGFRFFAYSLHWWKVHPPPRYHGPYLAFSFSMLTAVFGIALLVLLLVFA